MEALSSLTHHKDQILDRDAAKVVVAVGQGRGFVIQAAEDRLIVTAGHCLPLVQRYYSAADANERTYPSLIGLLDWSEAGPGKLSDEVPRVWAECLFVDPVADVAVLGPPLCADVYEEIRTYRDLMERVEPLSITDPPEKSKAHLLSLEGQWFKCDVENFGGRLWLSHAAEFIVGGMSGSPIVADDGSAIGVMCTSSGGLNEKHTDGGPNPSLVGNLPGWLLRELKWLKSARRSRSGLVR
jgi:hypothetical protein